jgi:hypothetical protein
MEQNELLFAKLRQPVHISYIAKYILKESEAKTKEILDGFIEEGSIQESPLSKGYFQVSPASQA